MRGRDLHAFLPCGAVGNSGLGSHSHNDLFSLIVWAGGVEWITDPGTGCYTKDPAMRNRLRATAAHATLQLGVREQNAFGDGVDALFRMDERARPRVHEWTAEQDGARLVASHSGFARPGDSWTHRRSVRFHAGRGQWNLFDELWQVEGPPPTEDARLRFPLSPGTRCRIVDDPSELPSTLRPSSADAGPDRERIAAWLTKAGLTFWIAFELPVGSRVEVARAVYSPSYGVTSEGDCLVATLPAARRSEAATTLLFPAPELGA
jgi:hypothetical protein